MDSASTVSKLLKCVFHESNKHNAVILDKSVDKQHCNSNAQPVRHKRNDERQI
jgi:hypothetical protein